MDIIKIIENEVVKRSNKLEKNVVIIFGIFILSL